MSVSYESTQSQADTAHQCSRDADGAGGGNGHPSDPQRTALTNNKWHVAHSEDRDRMEEASDSEVPRPISTRTRSRLAKKRKKQVFVQDEVDERPVSDNERLVDE